MTKEPMMDASHTAHALPELPGQPPALTIDPAVVGTPVLTLRWRLVNRTLVAASRHLRTLRARRFAPGLDSWCRQHIDWTLLEGAEALPDGVLVIEVDELGHAVMRIEPFEPLAHITTDDLLNRACAAAPIQEPIDISLPLAQRLSPEGERMKAGDAVAAEVLWIVDEAQASATLLTTLDHELSGINSLVYDLFTTKQVTCMRAGLNLTNQSDVYQARTLIDNIRRAGGSLMLVSDEFGVVCADTPFKAGALTQEICALYHRLVEVTARKRTHARLAWRPASRSTSA